MNVSDSRVSMADIARLAEVRLPAVSNWRRRHHESFPRSERREGQELFAANEVAEWLDHRKIAKNDLKESELPGMTYGARFRKNLGIRARPGGAVEDALWRELDRHRGATDVGLHADLVLGLLYLCARDRVRWADLVAAAESPQRSWEIGELLEEARWAHRPSLPHLRRALPAAPTASEGHKRLGEIVRILDRARRGYESDDSQPISEWAARTFEYLLARFAASEGKRGLVVFTPASVVRVLVESVAPLSGESVLDPCCDSGGFLVGAARYVETHGGRSEDLSLSGQAFLERSWWLAKMNLELHGIVADLAPHPGSALREDLHAGRRFDVIMTNPPFNLSRWSSRDPASDPRWRYGPPPAGNGNFAWLQHVVSSLSLGGRAAVVMANSASSSEHFQEQAIRAAMVEDGVVEALIALPPQLFYSTAVPVTAWLLRRPVRRTDSEILFIDARAVGSMVSRAQRILTPADVRQIISTYDAWRNRREQGGYEDTPGFSASVTIRKIRENDYRLTPSRYVGTPIAADTTVETVLDLRRKLARLHARCVEVEAMANRQLSRIDAWTP